MSSSEDEQEIICDECGDVIQICCHSTKICTCNYDYDSETAIRERVIYANNICFYCFMEGRNQNTLEWDNLDEVYRYSLDALKYGKLDALDGRERYHLNPGEFAVQYNLYRIYNIGFNNPNIDIT